jgi:4-aminobutyrate aminotransferase-like enzyme
MKGGGVETRPLANAHATIETIECNFGNVLLIQPPLVITEKQLETVAATIMDGIKAFAAR